MTPFRNAVVQLAPEGDTTALTLVIWFQSMRPGPAGACALIQDLPSRCDTPTRAPIAGEL